MKPKEEPRIIVPVSIVKELITTQFPHWAHLPIDAVPKGGWDNYTFHLGETMSVRMPSAKRYIHQIEKEHQWLPKLAEKLSLPIPKPLALGLPANGYPWNWSVYQWIEGDTADSLRDEDQVIFAADIAGFLKELHGVDTTGGPEPGPFFRGASPSHYDSQTRWAITELENFIDSRAALSVWDTAISSEWNLAPVWVHGDFSPGNILVKNNRLVAVIDFGSLCVGDPACDLVIAWTLLKNEARVIFMEHLNLDRNTWDRARGWALWKALITLADVPNKTSLQATSLLKLIDTVIHFIE